MIDYSLSLRPVNPGNTESEKKVFASAQAREILDIEDLADHIQEHGSPYTADIIVGVARKLVSCIREQLLAGNKVGLGRMGSFYVTFSGEGVDNADDFNPQTHIESVNVRWERGDYFENLKDDTTFNLVFTRKEQAEQKKAMKAALNEEMANGATGSGEGTGEGTGGGGSNDNPGGGDVTE